jgi:hypothetical protein
MHAWLTAVADDRIAAAAPMIGVQGFGWALQHDSWQARVDSIPQVRRQVKKTSQQYVNQAARSW